jgi:molecular chaperone GrpE (heat shock protein)
VSQQDGEEASRQMPKEGADARLEQIAKLLEELVDDNTVVVAEFKKLNHAVREVGSDFERDLSALRGDLADALTYRALKDFCTELIGPLAAMERMLERADFTDPEMIAGHIRSLSVTLRAVLSRMGAEQVTIAVGEELYDPSRHRCVGVVTPDSSPFPDAAPHTVVRVVQDGYMLGRRPLIAPSVEIQSSRTMRATGK